MRTTHSKAMMVEPMQYTEQTVIGWNRSSNVSFRMQTERNANALRILRIFVSFLSFSYSTDLISALFTETKKKKSHTQTIVIKTIIWSGCIRKQTRIGAKKLGNIWWYDG